MTDARVIHRDQQHKGWRYGEPPAWLGTDVLGFDFITPRGTWSNLLPADWREVERIRVPADHYINLVPDDMIPRPAGGWPEGGPEDYGGEVMLCDGERMQPVFPLAAEAWEKSGVIAYRPTPLPTPQPAEPERPAWRGKTYSASSAEPVDAKVPTHGEVASNLRDLAELEGQLEAEYGQGSYPVLTVGVAMMFLRQFDNAIAALSNQPTPDPDMMMVRRTWGEWLTEWNKPIGSYQGGTTRFRAVLERSGLIKPQLTPIEKANIALNGGPVTDANAANVLAALRGEG